jgi:hypothetical protein
MMFRCFTIVLLLLVARAGHAKDFQAVNLITSEIETVERKIAEGDLQHLGQNGWSLSQHFVDVSKDLKSDPAFPGLVRRWEKLAAKAAAVAGGHAKEILGDGVVPPNDKEREQLFEEVESACKTAVNTPRSATARDMKNLKDNYAKYEKALARALKADPAAVRHKYGHFKLFECEWTIAQVQLNFEDNPIYDEATTERYKTCGYDEYVLRRLKMGGKWGPWEVDGVPGGNGYPLDCKKHPKVSKLSGNMASLIKQEYNYPRNAVWAIAGPPTTGEQDLRIYQYQAIRVYGKDIEVQTSACGDKDKKVVCEASGAKLVQTYNVVEHLIARAEVHHGAARADRCKEMYQKARHEASHMLELYQSESKSSGWDKTLKYKTRNDGILTEAKLVAKLSEMASQADERSVGKYCQK